MVSASGLSTQFIEPGEKAYPYNESILLICSVGAGSFSPQCQRTWDCQIMDQRNNHVWQYSTYSGCGFKIPFQANPWLYPVDPPSYIWRPFQWVQRIFFEPTPPTGAKLLHRPQQNRFPRIFFQPL